VGKYNQDSSWNFDKAMFQKSLKSAIAFLGDRL